MKGRLVTEHLSKLGLLGSDNIEEITEAKKLFWAEKRKAARSAKRKTEKSVQIFFNPAEYGIVSGHAKNMKLSITRFVKETSLNAAYHSNSLYNDYLLHLRKLCFRAIEELENQDGKEHLIPLLMDLQGSIMKIVSFKIKSDDY